MMRTWERQAIRQQKGRHCERGKRERKGDPPGDRRLSQRRGESYPRGLGGAAGRGGARAPGSRRQESCGPARQLASPGSGPSSPPGVSGGGGGGGEEGASGAKPAPGAERGCGDLGAGRVD